MNRPIHDLLDRQQVADLLGLKLETIKWHQRHNMPAPDIYIGRSPAWKRSTIEAWQRQRDLNPHVLARSDGTHVDNFVNGVQL